MTIQDFSIKPKGTALYTIGVGILFLGVLVGMLYVMFFIPMPASNEKPIMLVCGVITTAAVMALNNLAKGGNQVESLIKEIDALKRNEAVLKAQVAAHQHTIDRLMDRFMPDSQEHPVLRIGADQG